jgi:hypothetical protein
MTECGLVGEFRNRKSLRSWSQRFNGSEGINWRRARLFFGRPIWLQLPLTPSGARWEVQDIE